MTKFLSIVSLVAVIAVATPLALAQKPGKDKDKGKDDQGQGGSQFGGRNNPPKSNPIPPPKLRPSNPQPPPQPDPQPRRFTPPDTGKQGKSTNQPPEFDPRRFNKPTNDNPPTPGRVLPPLTGSGGDNNPGKQPSGRQLPKGFDPDDSQDPRRGNLPKLNSGGGNNNGNNGKPDFTPPSRGGGIGDLNPRRFNTDPPKDGNEGKVELPRRQINPSGKPRNLAGGDAPKLNGQPVDPSGNQPSEPVLRKSLGKPSGHGFQPVSEGGNNDQLRRRPTELSKSGGGGGNLAAVESPARFRKSQKLEGSMLNTPEKPLVSKPFKPVKPVNPLPPEGGRVYRGQDYHHEYSHHHHSSSSWALGIGVSDGSTAFSFGYAKGGGHSAFALGVSSGYPYGYDPCYHPYWHNPCWYEPVVWTPCYAAPVYYSPVYAPVVVDPWAYNSSSFAFGYSSFGGCALSSFSFAYSTSHWGVGFGYTAAPCYTIYAPAYDPYFRSVYVPGYYEIVDEQVWVDGSYDEVVSTPVVDTVVDPLGNTYDAVTQPGAVDYQWREGHWTTERRRIYHEGHWENVATF